MPSPHPYDADHPRQRSAPAKPAKSGSSAPRSTMVKSLAALVSTLALASTAQAVTNYSLGGDFSNAANPNGVWSFVQGSTALTHFAPSGTNALNPAVANGFWGTGSNLDVAVPFVAKTTQDGATISGLSNNDFLTGDVIAHSANSSPSLFINWTAPAAGTISYSASAWYAHSTVTRVNEILVTLDGVSQGAALVINNSSNRSAPIALSGTGLAVDAGDVLSFEVRKLTGEPFGSITGLSETVLFTAAVPEPGTYALMLAGLLGIVAVTARQRKHG